MRVTDAPPRPSVTILLAGSLALWAGCASSYGALSETSADTCTRIALGSLAACALLGLLAGVFRHRALIVCAFLAGGALLGSAGAAHLAHLADSLDKPLSGEYSIVVDQDSRRNVRGEAACAHLIGGGLDGVRVMAYVDGGDELRAGQVATVKATLSAFDAAERDYPWQNGCVVKLSASAGDSLSGGRDFDNWISRFRSEAIDAMEERFEALGQSGAADEALGVSQALSCGYRRRIQEDGSYDEFKTCGLAHLVAVSGAHLVMVTSLAASALRLLAVNRKVSICALIALMGAYYVLAGAPLSALRACTMSSVGLLALLGKRRPHSLNALGLVITAFIALDPSVSVSASFSLSALSTLGIVLFSPLFSFLLSNRLKAPAAVSEPLALSLSAMACSQLFSAALFNRLPLVSPLANVVSAPLFPLCCSLSLLYGIMCALGLPGAEVAGMVAGAFVAVLDACASLLARVPFAAVPLAVDMPVALSATAALCLALWAAWSTLGRAHIALFFMAMALAVAVPLAVYAQEDSIVMLDVGQGDAFLLRSNGQALLVDTGNHDALLLEELGRNRVFALDGVVISHADDDHCGSLDALFQNVVVDRLLVADDMLEEGDEKCRGVVSWGQRARQGAVGLGAGDEFRIGDFTLRVVWPHAYCDAGGNADSLCLLAEYDGDADGLVDFTALFTGDAEADQVAAMVEEGSVGKVDVLKVGHHGSKNGLTIEEARILNPAIALISVGAGNRYGHPAPSTLETLQDVGADVFRTDADGEVKCVLAPSGIRVYRLD